jgi:hypothetical protein
MTVTASPGSTFTLFDCNTITGVGQLLDYPPELTRSSSTSRPPSLRSSSSSSSSSTPPPVVTITQSSMPTSDSAGGNPPVAPIVGGTIGGVAVLALAATGVFFLLRRRQRRNEDPVVPTIAPVEKTMYPPGTSLSPGPGTSDPRYSYPGGMVPSSYSQQLPAGYDGSGLHSPHNSIHVPNTSPVGGQLAQHGYSPPIQENAAYHGGQQQLGEPRRLTRPSAVLTVNFAGYSYQSSYR